jgi:hypothetical protein
VAHACNSSYSRGSDQDDLGSKPAQTNSSKDPILKKPITKKGVGGMGQGPDEVAQGVGPEFKPQYQTHKKSNKCLLWTSVLKIY